MRLHQFTFPAESLQHLIFTWFLMVLTEISRALSYYSTGLNLRQIGPHDWKFPGLYLVLTEVLSLSLPFRQLPFPQQALYQEGLIFFCLWPTAMALTRFQRVISHVGTRVYFVFDIWKRDPYATL